MIFEIKKKRVINFINFIRVNKCSPKSEKNHKFNYLMPTTHSRLAIYYVY